MSAVARARADTPHLFQFLDGLEYLFSEALRIGRVDLAEVLVEALHKAAVLTGEPTMKISSKDAIRIDPALTLERAYRLRELTGYLRALARNLQMDDTALALDLALAGIDADIERMDDAQV